MAVEVRCKGKQGVVNGTGKKAKEVEWSPTVSFSAAYVIVTFQGLFCDLTWAHSGFETGVIDTAVRCTETRLTMADYRRGLKRAEPFPERRRLVSMYEVSS